MPSSTNTLAEAAAETALVAARASAELGMTSGKLGYTLTTQALQEEQAAMVFPLLALSISSIAAGYAAYVAVDAVERAQSATVSAEFAAAQARIRSFHP